MTRTQMLEAIVEYVLANQELFTEIELNTTRVLYPEDFIVDNLVAFRNVALHTRNDFYFHLFMLGRNIEKVNVSIAQVAGSLERPKG